MLQNITFLNIFLIIIILVLIFLLIFQNGRLKKQISKIRKDAIKRSRSVINGQITEQIAPFLPNFPCSPSDVKFLGQPIDFIGFSGLSENDEIDEILFIEVKSGKSELSNREKSIKRAIEEKRIRHVLYRF